MDIFSRIAPLGNPRRDGGIRENAGAVPVLRNSRASDSRLASSSGPAPHLVVQAPSGRLSRPRLGRFPAAAHSRHIHFPLASWSGSCHKRNTARPRRAVKKHWKAVCIGCFGFFPGTITSQAWNRAARRAKFVCPAALGIFAPFFALRRVRFKPAGRGVRW